MEIKDLQHRYVNVLEESETIRNQYAGKQGSMSGEDIARWTKLLDESDGLKAQIDLIKRDEASRAWGKEASTALKLAGNPGAGDADEATAIKAAIRPAFKQWLAYGPNGLKGDGLKALAAQEGDLGGFLVIPQELVQRLITTVKDLVFMRQMGTVFSLDRAESLGVPVLDTDLGDPTWTAEISTGSEDLTTPFGKRQLSPPPLARRIKISNKLLRQASIDPEAIVMDRLAYRFARVEENAFLNGTGQDQPLGIFVASANGISTARDTACASATAIAADDIITCRYQLKPQYREKAAWFIHRTILMQMRLLKDTNNNYLWNPGLAGYAAQGAVLIGSQPETLLGHRILESELAPSTIAASDYVAVLGDYSFYWIADALNMQIQRLVELYAEAGQTGFIGRRETDGMPVLEEAFVRLIMHA
ncbi:MAG TPA: phage major capsid protein [Chloroflexota bacterium]